MGEVYVAEDQELGRPVAVKLLDDRLSGSDEARRRFLREARAAAQLSGHPNIVTIYDVGECDGRPYMVMEYLPGGTVADRAREGRISTERALAWLRDAADALDAAHAMGIVHRDVKPSNLLLDAGEEAHVADFGIARVADSTTAGLTDPGQILGTAGYLSPEQALGREATAASDNYALAVVAYELLTGGRPFGGRTSEAAEVAAHIHEPIPPPSERLAGLPAEVDALFERALAKRPDDRYRSCRGFVRALELVLRRREGSADERATVLVRPEPDRPRTASASLRRPLLVLVALLVAGLAGGIAGAMLGTGGGDTSGGALARTVTEQVVATREITETVGGDTVAVTERETSPTTVTVETVASASAPPDENTSDEDASDEGASDDGASDDDASDEGASDQGASDGGSLDAHALNDQGYSLMQQARYEEALPLLNEAVRRLRGAGPGDPYEAWANYNLGYTLLQLGECSDAVKALRRSDRLQDRGEVNEALARATSCA